MPLIDLKSDLTWRGSKPPNAVPDKGTLYQETRFEQNTKTGDVSTKTRGYAQYAKIYTSPLRDITSKGSFSLTDSKYNFGVATRLTQGGEGYPFPDYNGTVYQWRNADGKEVAHTGFNSKATYGALSGDGKGDTGARTGYLAATYITNSPIKAMYRKYKMRDAAYNVDYIRQPFILSGIQDIDVLKPERYGIDSKFSLDIPAGGITTYASRAADDLGRIGKFLASSKGLLFLTKQVGLQLMNPNVQDVTGRVPANPFLSVTKQFTPLKLLANVASAGLGLRTSRHGIIPFSDIGGYETIVKGQSFRTNRLYRLREELIESNITRLGDASRIASTFSNIQEKLGFKGTPIQTLSGITGPGSVLGVGLTTIRLAERTNRKNILTDQSKQRYNIGGQYASAEAGYRKSNTNDNSSNSNDANSNSRTNIDNWSLSPNVRTDTQFSKIGEDYLNITVNKQIPDSLNNPVQRTNAPIPKLNDYATVAYGRIPSRGRHNYTGIPNNFVLDNIDAKDYENLITGPAVDKNDLGFKDYATKNVQEAFGYLNYGAKNTKANGGDGNPSDYKWQDDTSGKSDIINFQIGSTKLRAYIDSISDSFTPTIDSEQPLGSPINAVRYTSLDRSVSVSFKMAVLAQTDLKLIYRKMKELQGYAQYSTQAGNAFTLQTINVVIGDLYNFTGYVESVTFDWDSEMPWEITSAIGQVPLYCNASIDFKYLVPRAGFALVGNE